MSQKQQTWKSRKVKSSRPKLNTKAQFSMREMKIQRFKRPPFKRILRVLAGMFLIGGTVGVVMLTSLFLWYARGLPSIEQVKSGAVVIAESTKIYDRTGTHLLYTIHGEENRTRIVLEEMPDSVKWATIATEDQDFYTREFAIDFKGIARALLMAVRYHTISGPGGSTITQQFVKNLILTRERTVERKVKEIILAFRIEKAFSRDEILELYLNQIPYGSNAYGIEQAAQTFLGKPSSELTLAEAAVLAALPKATTYYSPYGSHVDELFARQKVILKQMLDEGYISEDQWSEVREQKIVFNQRLTNIEAPHFVIYVRELLAEKFGEIDLEQGGLKVITTLDFDLQKIAERVVKEGAVKNDELGADNAALVAIDPKTGEILAMVGSRDYFDADHDGNFNVALAERQPGSSFKPIVYAALFTKGYTPNTILYDVKTDFAPSEEKEYIPLNYDLKERGPVNIRQALQGSLNIPAVKALYLAGIDRVVDYAKKLGYSTITDPEHVGLSLALGGGGVKLIEHVNAFSIFANSGVYHDIVALLKVEDARGEVLEEFEPKAGEQVFPKEIVNIVSDVLSDNEARTPVFGANSYLYLGPHLPSAVKTGTTNDYRDAWTIGYTPTLAAGVWVGNNNYTPMNSGVGGSKAAAPIWNAFMKEALKGKEGSSFPKVEIPKTGKPILDGDIEGIKKVKIDKVSGKLATEYTPEEYIEEETFADFHSILHFVKKDDPLGTPPEEPSSDPQYKNWELGVAAWAEKSELVAEFKKPPEENDDVHVPANIPYIKVIAPVPQEEIVEDSYLVSISTQATRGVRVVQYYIDSAFRESAGISPFDRTIYFGSLADGVHTITVKATDDAGNSASVDVEVLLKRGREQNEAISPLAGQKTPKVSFVSPQTKTTLSADQFPFTIRIFIQNTEIIQRLDVYYNVSGGNPIHIAGKNDTIEEEMEFEWVEPPIKGTYPLYVITRDMIGDSKRFEVDVKVE